MQGAASVLDFVDHFRQFAAFAAVYAFGCPSWYDWDDLHIDLGSAFAHGQVSPDAGMGSGVGAVEGDHGVDRSFGVGFRRAGGEGFRVEAVEAELAGADRGGDRVDLAADGTPQWQEFGAGESIRDAESAQALGVEQGQVSELAP